MDSNTPPAGGIWLLAVHPALTADLTAWLAARGLQLGQMPGQAHAEQWGAESVWITSPADERVEALLRAENDRVIDADLGD